jgi:hypothetical protein
MTEIRIVSVSGPFLDPRLASLGLGLVSRGQVMGFLPDAVDGEVTLDLSLVRAIGHELAARDVAQEASFALERAARRRNGRPGDLEGALRSAITAVDESPQPDGEWGPARELLGDDLLARLVGISPASLRRYAAGTRRTPDGVAWRLHVVARILAALLGSYNAYGIRRWFDRPRAALAGRAPAQVIAAAESESDERLLAAVGLAESLVGAAAAA